MALLITACAIIAIAGGLAIYALQSYHGEDAWVYIPKDATKESVRDSLRSSLGNGEGTRVWALWSLAGGSPATAHGAYLISSNTRSIDTARRLKQGAQTPVKVAFPSVRVLEQVANRVMSTLEASPEDFMAASDSILPAEGYTPEEFVAAYLPDTYEMYWTASGSQVVERLLNYRRQFWNDSRREKACRLGLTPMEVTTLASIVAEESAKSDEHPVIARLYLNRLKKGMLLQADPTVKFATGDPSLRRILNKHLSTPSPYNTYLHKGLPPGPIRVVAPAVIDAVLDAPDHSYLYMCAKEDFSGRHNFATDYATHMANARRYQAALNKRGIK